MEDTAESINELRRWLAQAAATKRTVTSHSKRLGTISDTQALRAQINKMVARLKDELERGAAAATKASKAVMDDMDGPEPVKARHLTNVQQMERQLMAIANEYPGLVRGIAAKQQQSAPREPERGSRARADEIPLMGVSVSSPDDESGSSGQQQQQQRHGPQQEQVQQQDVSKLEVQQLSQDVHERDRDIQELVGSALEIRQVAADIACLIEHQAPAVEQVAVNIENVSHNVDLGTEQIARAHARQRKFKIDCLGWVLIILGAILGTYVGFFAF